MAKDNPLASKPEPIKKASDELTVEELDHVVGGTGAFEIKDFSLGVENPTTIGSATGGAGAGKIK